MCTFFEYIYNSPDMDEEAGKCLSGWSIYKPGKKIAGGLAPTLLDALHTNPTNSDSDQEMTKLMYVCDGLFSRSSLSNEQEEIMFAALLRYWLVFVQIVEEQVKLPHHFIIQQVKRACSDAGVDYKTDFLRWAQNVSDNFKSKNALGLAGQSMRDIPKDFKLDGRNLIQQNAHMKDMLLFQNSELSEIKMKSDVQSNDIKALKELVIHQANTIKILSDQVSSLHLTVNKIGSMFVESSNFSNGHSQSPSSQINGFSL